MYTALVASIERYKPSGVVISLIISLFSDLTIFIANCTFSLLQEQRPCSSLAYSVILQITLILICTCSGV